MLLKHITQLSHDVIGQIAAGEVVERPAAAIKELVENSMDAGATAITVEIRDGGLSYFRVVDNGSGIQPSDIRLAFARHATSKITKADDLVGIKTLGFRGEALASIAAVSKVTCTTRIRSAEYGVSVQNDGGIMGDIREAACPEGTSFVVKDLFFNAPVRRKFLKKPSTETGYVSDLMMRFILSHPQISFRYIADGKSIYHSAGDGKLDSAVLSIYGLSTLEKLRKVSGNMNGLVLEGYIGVADLSRGNRAHQSFILNGRLIKSNLITAAMEEACRQRTMIGRFPMCVLHLTLPFEQTDVNVHPNKWEVRFQNEPAIREAVYTLIYEALQDKTPLAAAMPLFEENKPHTPPAIVTRTILAENISDSYNSKPNSIIPEQKFTSISDTSVVKQPVAAPVKPAPVSPLPVPPRPATPLVVRSSTPEFPSPVVDRSGFTRHSDVPVAPVKSVEPANEQPAEQITLPVQVEKPAEEVIEQTTVAPVEEQFNELSVRLVGAVFNTYIILECDDRMLLCDQHAVHERLLYERMMKACEGDSASQMLLTPVIMQLTHREYEIYRDSADALQQAGFDVSDFGDLSVQLRAVPMVLGNARSIDCLRDALDDLAESGQISQQKRTDRIIQMACKHAVKGGEKLPMDALMELVRRMIRDNVTPTCPHGRPLVIEVSRRDLEKRFRRIQN